MEEDSSKLLNIKVRSDEKGVSNKNVNVKKEGSANKSKQDEENKSADNTSKSKVPLKLLDLPSVSATTIGGYGKRKPIAVPEPPSEPQRYKIERQESEQYLYKIVKEIQKDLSEIKCRQTFALQNIGSLKAEVIQIKEAVCTTKWFTDSVMQRVLNIDWDNECFDECEEKVLRMLQHSAAEICCEPRNKYMAIALYEYKAGATDEISFVPDDIITEIEMVDEGWWLGCCNGKRGLFPANYVILQ